VTFTAIGADKHAGTATVTLDRSVITRLTITLPR
jgi:hypothetical protein